MSGHAGMSRDRDDAGPAGSGSKPSVDAPPDGLLDALFDRGLDEQARDELVLALRRHPVRRREVLETVAAIEQLRSAPRVPDLAGPILAETQRRRGFLTRRMRRAVDAGRLAVAASLLVGLASVAYLQRAYPDTMRLHEQPTPVNDVERAVYTDSAAGQAALASGVDAVRRVLPLTRIDPSARLRFDQGVASLGSASGSIGLASPGAWAPSHDASYTVVTLDLATGRNRSTVLLRPGLAFVSLDDTDRAHGSIRFIGVEPTPSNVGPVRCVDLP